MHFQSEAMHSTDVDTKSIVSSQKPNDVATSKEQHSKLSMWIEAYKTTEREPDEAIRGKWKNFADTSETQLKTLSMKKSRPNTDQQI